MAVVFSQDTQYAQEMRKWNAYPSEFGPAGRPFVHYEFPKMLYKAERNAAGKIVICDSHKVQDEMEERNLRSRGFHFGQDAAIKAIEDEQLEHGTLAAEREWEIQHGRLSERAVAEVRAAEAAHRGHLPMVPETPVKRRGRKPKAEATHAPGA